MPNQLLEVKDLETQFSTPDGTVHAVNGISFSLKEGETLINTQKQLIQRHQNGYS